MPAKDLGVKHTCFKCGTKFYDMKRTEPLCPKCGADQRQAVSKPAPSEKRSRAPARPVEPKAEEVETPEVEVEADEDEDGDQDEPSDEDDDA